MSRVRSEKEKYAKYDYHGGPFDRGAADSYYWRGRDPHYYPNGTATNPRIPKSEMTDEEIAAYYAGYDWNEEMGDKKDWG
jgi:hypothetical protein